MANSIDLSFLEAAALKYLESHPEVIERLIADLITKIMAKLEEQHAAK